MNDTTMAALIEALELALPYVQRVAATAPTEMMRQQRQREAVKAVERIQAVLTSTNPTGATR